MPSVAVLVTMDSTCEFCEGLLPSADAQNVALLRHIRQSPECREQFDFMVANLQTSWTASMSGP